MGEVIATLFGVILGLGVLLYAYSVYREIKSLPDGNDKMREIAGAIADGAMVFLRREYRIIGIFVIVVFILLGIFIDWKTAVAYVGGAVCSLTAGFFGMKAATKEELAADSLSPKAASVTVVETPHGQSVTGETIDKALGKHKPMWAFMAHWETGSGRARSLPASCSGGPLSPVSRAR